MVLCPAVLAKGAPSLAKGAPSTYAALSKQQSEAAGLTKPHSGPNTNITPISAPSTSNTSPVKDSSVTTTQSTAPNIAPKAGLEKFKAAPDQQVQSAFNQRVPEYNNEVRKGELVINAITYCLGTLQHKRPTCKVWCWVVLQRLCTVPRNDYPSQCLYIICFLDFKHVSIKPTSKNWWANAMKSCHGRAIAELRLPQIEVQIWIWHS